MPEGPQTGLTLHQAEVHTGFALMESDLEATNPRLRAPTLAPATPLITCVAAALGFGWIEALCRCFSAST
jgi:hypothetical protein